MSQIKESALVFQSEVEQGIRSDFSGFSYEELLQQCTVQFKEVRGKSQLFRYDTGNTYRKFASKALNAKKACEEQAILTGNFVDEKKAQLQGSTPPSSIDFNGLIGEEAAAAIAANNDFAR